MTKSASIRAVCSRSNLRTLLINGFIAFILVLFAVDTMPCTPESVRQFLRPFLNATGLWQGTWSLFAPVPDSRNHRLQADIEWADGTHRIWKSPDWQTQTAWQRFVSHRHSEWLEKIWDDDSHAAWPGFAKSLVSQQQHQLQFDPSPKRVNLSVEWGDISPPTGETWPLKAPFAFDHEREFFTLIFSE